MYEITLKYQGWFYVSRLHRPDRFTTLGAVLDSHGQPTIRHYLAWRLGMAVLRSRSEEPNHRSVQTQRGLNQSEAG